MNYLFVFFGCFCIFSSALAMTSDEKYEKLRMAIEQYYFAWWDEPPGRYSEEHIKGRLAAYSDILSTIEELESIHPKNTH